MTESTSQEPIPAAWPGHHEPLGSTWSPESTNFAVYSPDATRVDVCLIDDDGSERRYHLTEQTLGIWQGAVPDVQPGQRYGYRAQGPWAPPRGYVFNSDKLLLDPYARAVSGELRYDDAVYGYVRPDSYDVRDQRDSAPYVPLSVVVADEPFDWQGTTHPRTLWTDTVIYEMHVKGLSQLNPAIPEDLRGTYAGLAHPASVQYLTELGITAVELLPVHHFVSEPAVAARGLVNYWGYNTLGYFAPHAAYSSAGDRGEQVREFKEMVRTLHAAGIEVLLDVVYNHTAEGPPHGPTLSLRGLDDRGHYLREDMTTAPDRYRDLTGCGNTVDVSAPPTLRLVMDSLRYWVTEMGVDGFRFDLASALARTHGDLDLRSDFLTAIGQDPVLRNVKLIAEPWDLTAEGYLVGRFPPPWVEWNDKYRDTMRDFWRGASGGVRAVTTRLAGSSDLYADDGRAPYASVNMVTAHDGFTLRDLVSYDRKHNEANGEDNRDGTDDNRSSNWGVEGETDDPDIVHVRHRVAAGLMATLCLSAGVPMITMGDERGRTQGGNNNPYCQDNEISWLDWETEPWGDLLDLTKTALALRHRHPALRQRHFLEGRPTKPGGAPDLAWMHPSGREMSIDDWHDGSLLTVGMFVSGDPLRAPGPRGELVRDASFLVWLHAGPDEAVLALPENAWVWEGEIVLSTDPGHLVGSKVFAGDTLTLAPRTVVVIREL